MGHLFACGNTSAQKIGGPSCPCAAHGHDLAHKSGHGVGLNDAFDRSPTIGIVDAQEGPRRPKCRFTGGYPKREISHARRAFKANLRQSPQPMGGASSRAPRISGRTVSNSRQSWRSVRRHSSAIGPKARKIARSARSERQTTSSMPFRTAGRAAWKSTSSQSVRASWTNCRRRGHGHCWRQS